MKEAEGRREDREGGKREDRQGGNRGENERRGIMEEKKEEKR